MHRQLASDELSRKRLTQEATQVQQLRHEHIVAVYDWSNDPVLDTPFLVMEYLQGRTLASVLAQRLGTGGYPLAEALELLRPVAQALDYAWTRHKLIHRDIKPDNLFITEPGGIVKLLDFGLAARMRSTASHAGIALLEKAGTLDYAPPEAAAKQKTWQPSLDVYSLAVVLYQLLDSDHDLPFSRRAPGTPWPNRPEQLSDAQWEVLQLGLAYQQEQRIQTAADLIEQLSGAKPRAVESLEREAEEDATRQAQQQAEREAAEKAKLTEVAELESQSVRKVAEHEAQKRVESDAQLKTEREAAQKVLENAQRQASEQLRAIEEQAIKLAEATQKQQAQQWSLNNSESASQSASSANTSKPTVVHDDVQFTVYRPKVVRPNQWNDLVAAAHLEERREDAPTGEADPREKVRNKARAILGNRFDDYRDVTREGSKGVPSGSDITFLFAMDDVEFNPPHVTFQWLEDEHTVNVRMRASQLLDGQTASGQMSVFVGAILIADVPLKIRVDSSYEDRGRIQTTGEESISARPYRKIFASYSHKDMVIVEQFERYAESLGDRYLRDWKDLRSGENWDERLRKMINEADVFQLFWSSHAMESSFVREEWEYALGLGRHHFVRPVYWEQPFPERSNLPTPSLKLLHFQQLNFGSSLRSRIETFDLPVVSKLTCSPEVDLHDDLQRRYETRSQRERLHKEYEVACRTDSLNEIQERQNERSPTTPCAPAPCPPAPRKKASRTVFGCLVQLLWLVILTVAFAYFMH